MLYVIHLLKKGGRIVKVLNFTDSILLWFIMLDFMKTIKNRRLYGMSVVLLSLAVTAGCATLGGKLSGAGIGDSALAACVRNSRYDRVEDVTRLKCEDAGIEDISGIGRFYNLKELQLAGNYIAEIAPLASLKNLRVLNLDLSPVIDLSPLASLTSLESLSIMEGFVKHVEPLGKLTRLTNLDLGDNLVIDVTPLSSLTRLVTLDLRGNHVKKGVAKLASLKNAKRIVLTRNINVPYKELGALIKALGTDTIEWERDSQNPWAGLAD